ncbi:MAG: class D sortase [Bryobacteraceae bacterium]|nr:class D sortase [Bryobacteraceae bacterium]
MPRRKDRSCALEGFLLGLGAVLIIYVAYIYGGQHWYQWRQEQTLEEARSKPEAARQLDPNLVGNLSIPRVGVSAMVRTGVDENTLDIAIGHIPGTALPGEAGNVGVAAHRDTFFRGLRNIRGKDEIVMETPNGTFRYVVESTKIVKPENVEVLRPTEKPSLTLVTCYPFGFIGKAPKRFIVRARQTSAPESLQGS